jgi:hypothetical protein
MTDWKTTVTGVLAALLPWLKTVVPDLATVLDATGTLALALFAYFAKDKEA